jgi:hypothetical protein
VERGKNKRKCETLSFFTTRKIRKKFRKTGCLIPPSSILRPGGGPFQQFSLNFLLRTRPTEADRGYGPSGVCWTAELFRSWPRKNIAGQVSRRRGSLKYRGSRECRDDSRTCHGQEGKDNWGIRASHYDGYFGQCLCSLAVA